MSSRRSQAAPGSRSPRRSSGAQVLKSHPNLKPTTIRAIGNAGSRTSALVVICPVCEEPVKTRQRSTLVGSHRVGTSLKQSYPCAGNGMSTEGLEVVSE